MAREKLTDERLQELREKTDRVERDGRCWWVRITAPETHSLLDEIAEYRRKLRQGFDAETLAYFDEKCGTK